MDDVGQGGVVDGAATLTGPVVSPPITTDILPRPLFIRDSFDAPKLGEMSPISESWHPETFPRDSLSPAKRVIPQGLLEDIRNRGWKNVQRSRNQQRRNRNITAPQVEVSTKPEQRVYLPYRPGAPKIESVTSIASPAVSTAASRLQDANPHRFIPFHPRTSVDTILDLRVEGPDSPCSYVALPTPGLTGAVSTPTPCQARRDTFFTGWILEQSDPRMWPAHSMVLDTSLPALCVDLPELEGDNSFPSADVHVASDTTPTPPMARGDEESESKKIGPQDDVDSLFLPKTSLAQRRSESFLPEDVARKLQKEKESSPYMLERNDSLHLPTSCVTSLPLLPQWPGFKRASGGNLGKPQPHMTSIPEDVEAPAKVPDVDLDNNDAASVIAEVNFPISPTASRTASLQSVSTTSTGSISMWSPLGTSASNSTRTSIGSKSHRESISSA